MLALLPTDGSDPLVEARRDTRAADSAATRR